MKRRTSEEAPIGALPVSVCCGGKKGKQSTYPSPGALASSITISRRIAVRSGFVRAALCCVVVDVPSAEGAAASTDGAWVSAARVGSSRRAVNMLTRDGGPMSPMHNTIDSVDVLSTR